MPQCHTTLNSVVHDNMYFSNISFCVKEASNRTYSKDIDDHSYNSHSISLDL